MPDSLDPSPARPPGARDLLPLLLIAPAVTAVLWWTDRTPVYAIVRQRLSRRTGADA